MANGGAFPIIVVVGFIALVIGGIILGSLQARKRRQELAAWAAAHGLSFSEGHDHGFDERHPAFRVLRSGQGGRYAYNIMTGVYRNRSLAAFDYHYETYSTDKDGNRTTQHHRLSAVIVASEIPLKPLDVRPEGFFDKIGAAFGFEDINFESAEFSRTFKVTSPDRRWAYDVLHARAMEFLLARPPFSLQLNAGGAIYWTGGTWTPEQFEAAADTVTGLFDLLPDYVRQQQGETFARNGDSAVDRA